MQPLNLVLSKLGNVKKQGKEYIAKCPAHEDKKPSLSVSNGDDGRVLIYCHAGCETSDILAAIGLEVKDLFSDNGNKPKSEPLAIYDYVDKTGIKYQVLRYFPKDFKVRRPDGAGDWIYDLKGVRRIPYNLLAVRQAIKENESIFVCEGEKDCDTLDSLGICATTNSGGVGGFRQWNEGLADYFEGVNIVILPDNDKAGREHALKVAHSSLKEIVTSIKIVELPNLPDKGDVTDWIKAGHSKEELIKLVSKAEEWQPKADEIQTEPFALLLRDFMDAGSLEIEWLWEGILPKPSLGILAAKPKFGKTLLSFNLAIAISLGCHYLGRKVKQTDVLIVQLEDPEVIIRNRFSKMGIGDEEHIFIRAGMPMTKEDWKLLNEFIAEKQIGLIIIDPFIFAFSGNEQDATATSIFLKSIRELIFATGCSVLLVHHHRKSQGEHGDQIRGSSAILGAVDVALELIREDEDNPTATLKITSRFASVEPEIIQLDTDTLTWRSNGSAKDWKQAKRYNEILDIIKDETEPDIRTIAEALEQHPEHVRRDIKKMVEAGSIIPREIRTKGRPKTVYNLPNISAFDDIENELFSIPKSEHLPSLEAQNDFSANFHNPMVNKNAEKPMLADSWQCTACQSTDYWIGESGLNICSICHPKPEIVNA